MFSQKSFTVIEKSDFIGINSQKTITVNDFQEGVHVSMENVILSGRDAVSFLTSSLVKQLDADNEFAAYISRSSNNFMAYLSGSMDFTPLLCSVEGRPRMSKQEGARLAQML